MNSGLIAIFRVTVGLLTIAPLVCSSAEPIKVGILHSLSGTTAISETPLKDAALMAIDEINARGGVLGRKLDPVVVDPASNWPLAAEKAKQLIQQDKVSVLFGCWTEVCRKSVLPVVEESNSLLYYPAHYGVGENSKNIYYTGSAIDQLAFPAIDYLMNSKGGSAMRFLLLSTASPYSLQSNKLLRQFLHARGVSESDILEEQVDLRQSDYQGAVARLSSFGKQSRRTIVISALGAEASIAFSRELESQRLNSSELRVLALRLDEQDFRGLSVAPLIGYFTASGYFMSIRNPANDAFTRAWATYAKAKNLPVQKDSPLTTATMEATYVGIYLWKQAVERAKSTDTDKVIAAMAGSTFQAPSGTVVTMDGKTHRLQRPIVLGEVKADGRIAVSAQLLGSGASALSTPLSISGGSSGSSPLKPPTGSPAPRIVDPRAPSENRGQGEVNSPAVVVALSGGTLPQMPSGDLTAAVANQSKWGSSEEAALCLTALSKLKSAGRAGGHYQPPKRNESTQIEAESRFSQSCLRAPLDNDLASRVGLLRSKSGVVCTVTLIGNRHAITARHCLFAVSSNWKITTVPSQLKDWRIQFGGMESGRRIRLVDAWTLARSGSPNTWDRWPISDSTIADNEVESRTLESSEQARFDVAVLGLSEDVFKTSPTPVTSATASPSERIHLIAFYPGYNLLPIKDDTGLRQQTAGICQVVEQKDSCIVHGCTVSEGGSGAALFVERTTDAGVRHLQLVGIHSAGTFNGTGCESPVAIEGTFNHAVSVPPGALAFFK